MGASVDIDGAYVGDTPVVLRSPLERRAYRVAVRAEGYVAWEERVRPRDGRLTVTAKLRPK